MQNNILQGTQQWLDAKQSKISASEIFSLVLHYCRPELEQMGFNLLEEKSFRTVQELFLKVKFGAKLSEIDPVHAEFGNGMEPYVAYRLGQELNKGFGLYNIERSKEFVINEDLHPLAACSPDGYIQQLVGATNPLRDFDNTCDITAEWGKGAMELKTANYFANFGSEKGSRLHYIFQLQMQMMVMELRWGVLAVLMPKEKQFDEPFFKGKVIGQLGFVMSDYSANHLSNFDQFYDLKYYIYPRLIAFQAMILKSLKCFQRDLDAYEAGDQNAFPRNSEDLAGLQREKQMWAQLWSDHYGKKELSGDDELDKMLNERYKYQEAKMFAEQDLDNITNEIYQKVKAMGFDKFTEIIGTKNRMSWIKNGQVRFYKINNKTKE